MAKYPKDLRLAIECDNGIWHGTRIYDLDSGRQLLCSGEVSVHATGDKNGSQLYGVTCTFLPAEVRITGMREARRKKEKAEKSLKRRFWRLVWGK